MSVAVTNPAKLSDKQLAAARRLGQDVCVVAGPGSGKTRVLIDRFFWLVSDRAIPPARILTITFTEKAANEIKRRLAKRFAETPARREEVERAYVSTIHAFCARLLRENAIVAGVDPQFEVLEGGAAAALLRNVADDVLEDIYVQSPDRMRRFLRSLAVATSAEGYVPDLAKSLIDIYSAMRIAGVDASSARLSPPSIDMDLARLQTFARAVLTEPVRTNTQNQVNAHAVIQDWAADVCELTPHVTTTHFRLLHELSAINKGHLVKGSVARVGQDDVKDVCARLHGNCLVAYYSAERELILEALEGIDSAYRQRKRAMSALDFDDLEEDAIRLLEEDEALRDRVRGQFEYVLMDELQDTNPLQWKLIGLIRQPDNFFAVGDINQSIFGFRHADPGLFKQFRSQVEAHGGQVDELRENYRSRPQVLAAVNNTFKEAPGVEPHTLDAKSEFTAPSSAPVEVICAHAETGEEGQRLEAQWIATRIHDFVGALELRSGPARFSDIAVLTRTNMATATLQHALDDYGIPSVVLGGLTFFETREVRDLIQLLAVLANPLNEIALAGLLRSPLFGLSDEDLLRLSLEGSLSEVIAHRPPPGWDLILSLREIRNSVSPDQLLRRVLDWSDYETGLSSRARANVDKLLSTLRDRYTTSPLPLSEMLAAIESAAPDAEAPPVNFGDAVRLMTIHKSKGLEFPIVFLPFLHTTRGTDFPVVSYSHQHGLGVKWADPHTRKGSSDALHRLIREHSQAAQEEEDNRLLYVGMTRAEEQLLLTYSDTKRARGKWPDLVSKGLGIDPEQALHAPVVNAEGVRVLHVDTAPPTGRVRQSPQSSASDYVAISHADSSSDGTASVSALTTWEQCPRKYYLSRYLRLDAAATSTAPLDDEHETTRDRGELDPTELGNQVHALLAGEAVPDAADEALQLASRFRASALGRQAAKATNKAHEFDFVFALEDLVIRGQIDLWFEHGRDLILLDYKTDRVSVPVSRDRIAPYELQIQLYAMALDRAVGRTPTRAYLYFLRPNETVEVDISPLALNAARQTVREFLGAQKSMTFPLREGDQCRYCKFRAGLCPAAAAAYA